jgi:putative transposase
MANTYSRCYFHLVFSPAGKRTLLHRDWKDELEKYITAIIQNRGHKLICINTRPDHIHILIGYNLNHLIPDLVNAIKVQSNKWINEKKIPTRRFKWQVGYGAFTCSHSQLKHLIRYIEQQEEHHRKRNFEEEYKRLLQEHEIDYEAQFLFEFRSDNPKWEE